MLKLVTDLVNNKPVLVTRRPAGYSEDSVGGNEADYLFHKGGNPSNPLDQLPACLSLAGN